MPRTSWSSTFGGPCATPTADRLAERGLRYNRFHTTALCSPTRQAMLTGRNHHSVGFGSITEFATAAPGYNAIRPNTAATIAEILRLNGYSTAQFGKCHEVPPWEASPIGPFDRWPTGMGFERFYGFVGGDTHQYAPALYDGTTPIEAPDDPDYHLSEDLAAKTVSWMRQQKTFAPDKPFFVYFAPGATHAPHHVPKQWIDKYAGKFDDGWDALREASLERQKQLGVVPADAELSAPNPEIPAWDDMADELKPVLARQMEVYAAFLEHTDAQVGKVVDGLEELGIIDDTLFVYVIGDNGASAEGTPQGTFNEMIPLNGFNDLETPEFMASHIDDFGGPDSYNHFWELYDTTTDWSQANDLSAEHPDKLHELQRLWLIEAVKYQVLPIDDRTAERFNPEIAGRPDLMAGRSSMRLDGHSHRISENAAPNTKNKSFAVTAELVVPDGGADGVTATQSGAFGGWSLYAKNGAAAYCYNFIGLDRSYVTASAPLSPGSHQVRVEFRYDGGGAGKGADLVLFVDGEEVGAGRTDRSIPYLISLDETLDVGTDAGTPVTDEYPARGNEFNGRIEWVQVDLEPDDHSHMVDPEAIFHARMVKQ